MFIKVLFGWFGLRSYLGVFIPQLPYKYNLAFLGNVLTGLMSFYQFSIICYPMGRGGADIIVCR